MRFRGIVLGGLGVVATGFGAWWAGWIFPGQTLEYRVYDYYRAYDVFWEVGCDTLKDGSDQRCYLQYVDVYRGEPEFAAAIISAIYHAGPDGQPEPHLRFDIEPGLSFSGVTMEVVTADGSEPVDVSMCDGNSCRFKGREAQAILDLMRRGEVMEVTIEEGRDMPAMLRWPMGKVGTMLDDLAAQRAARGLP